MPRKLEAQFDGRYLMSNVLMTSTMKSEPATPPMRLLSVFGVPTSAAMLCALGGSADGSLLSTATVALAAFGARAPAVPATATPVRNLRRSTFAPDSFAPGILRAMRRSLQGNLRGHSPRIAAVGEIRTGQFGAPG